MTILIGLSLNIILYIRTCVDIYHITIGCDGLASNSFRKIITLLQDAKKAEVFGSMNCLCTHCQSTSLNIYFFSKITVPLISTIFEGFFCQLFLSICLCSKLLKCSNCLFSRTILKHSHLHLHHPKYKFYGLEYFICSIYDFLSEYVLM
jgi:hypothetical protein